MGGRFDFHFRVSFYITLVPHEYLISCHKLLTLVSVVTLMWEQSRKTVVQISEVI